MPQLIKKSENTIDFQHFLEKFPIHELPLMLSEDSHHHFSTHNDPLPEAMIQQYISRYEAVTSDEEIAEYIACLRLPSGKELDYEAIVYWKADLLRYDYILATYDKKTGSMIAKKLIAGTTVEGEKVVRSAATINEIRQIFMAKGSTEKDDSYDANSSQAQQWEILENGMIE